MNRLPSRGSFFKAAHIIGDRLCKRAYWSNGMCNWMGKTLTGIDKQSRIENRALDPSLYGGTSGIGLFLSYLYLYTREERFHDTAIGAIKQSLRYYKNLPQNIRFGLHAGWLGVAYAPTKVGILLNNDKFLEQALEILMSLYSGYQKGDHHLDIISGNAGAIPALLEIYLLTFRDEKIYDLAIKLGDELVVSAQKESVGWSWNSNPGQPEFADRNLTGFAHGAAGIGYGLLELSRKTDRKDFEVAARKAFSYENHWFNQKMANWPDFRKYPSYDSNMKSSEFRYATAWCHGAPGIGLSRLRHTTSE